MAQAQRSPAPHKIPSNSKLSIPAQSRQGTLTTNLKTQNYLATPQPNDDDGYDQGGSPSTRPSKMMGLLGVGDGAPSRKSNANMSTKSVGDASFKYDFMDKIADKCCGCRRCEPLQAWIHNLQRIYIAILIVIVLAMTAG